MTLAELNATTKMEFVAAVGGAFEKSPWIAERAWHRRPFASFDDLATRLIQEVQAASPNEQLALLQTYPNSADALAQQYRKRFGWPFLFAAKDADPKATLEALQRRLKSAPDQEFQVALGHAFRIARFRLEETIS